MSAPASASLAFVPQATTTKPPSTASRALVDRVRLLIADKGLVGAARELGLSRQTTTALVAGLSVRPGSIALAEMRAPRLAVEGR